MSLFDCLSLFPDTVIFSSANENIAVNVVCRPTASSFSTALNNLITPPASADVPVYAAIVYAGLIAEGSGHLVLPSYVFTPKALSDQIEALATAFPKPVSPTFLVQEEWWSNARWLCKTEPFRSCRDQI